MTDPVYLLHLVMGAIIGGVGLACTMSIRREARDDVQTLLDGLDTAVETINAHAEAQHAEQIAFNQALVNGMEMSLARAQGNIEKAVHLHASHTDDTIQRVFTRSEARVQK